MMKKKIENFLRGVSSCLQLARMYGCGHPKFDQKLAALYEELRFILSSRQEFTVAVVDKELTSGDDIFFDLSDKLTDLIEKLSAKGIEKISFKKDIKPEELKSLFLFFLISDEKGVSLEDYLASHSVVNIKTGKIREFYQQNNKKEKKRSSLGELYLQSVSSLSSSLLDLIKGQPVDFINFGVLLKDITSGIGSHYQEILKLSKVRGKDIITFAHLLNVSFLAVCFSRALGFSEPECKKIGLAALFHDLGKLYISNNILKGKQINEKEFEMIKSHSLLGAELLLKYIDQIGELAVVVALEHHIRFDANGYPKLRFQRPLHFISMLVSICDVYDALSQRRDYKNSFPPEKIYNIMREGRGTHLHPELLDAFFKFIGVWPNGTIVSLTGGIIARVESQNPDDIFLPNVRVVSEPSGEIIDMRSKSENIKIERSLNPYKEGKKYLDV